MRQQNQRINYFIYEGQYSTQRSTKEKETTFGILKNFRKVRKLTIRIDFLN